MGLTCRPFPSPKRPFSPLKVSAGQIPPTWTLLMRQESIFTVRNSSLVLFEIVCLTDDETVHAIPDFYYALVPDTGGRPTPAWDAATHLQFMANHSISYAFLSISTPASNVFLGDQTLTIGLARLLNEWLAEVSAWVLISGRTSVYRGLLRMTTSISLCRHSPSGSPSSLSRHCHTSAHRKQSPGLVSQHSDNIISKATM